MLAQPGPATENAQALYHGSGENMDKLTTAVV